MSIKLKVLGLGLLAVLATSAFAVNASAKLGGHFVHEDPEHHVTVTGLEATGTAHSLVFVEEGAAESQEISCHHATYEGTVTATTTQSVTITPNWTNCTTGTSGSGASFDVDENGCHFTFTSGAIGETHHTVDLTCSGAGVVITHENCSIRIPPQSLKAITYTTITVNNKHALTMNVTAKGITSHYEAGICIFLGTSHKSEMRGSVTVVAENTLGVPVGITETTG